MVWYPAYLESKQEIVDFCITQRPDLKTGMIFDVDLKMADTAIFSYLFLFGGIKGNYNGVSGSSVVPLDELNLLWGASLAYNCEFMSYRGIIHYNVGGIDESRHGSVTTKFMRMQPMFFMGNNPGNLDPVMPFRSFKQIAQSFLDSYIQVYQDTHDINPMKPISGWDMSSRGYGANVDLDYVRQADAELTGTS